MPVSVVILGWKTKRDFAHAFHSFCRFSEGAFCIKSPLSVGREGQLKPGKLLNLTEDIGNEIWQFSIFLL